MNDKTLFFLFKNKKIGRFIILFLFKNKKIELYNITSYNLKL